MKNINYQRVGWLCRIQIREIRALEYISPLIAAFVMMLTSFAFHDGWTEIMTQSIRISLIVGFIAVFVSSGNALINDNGPLTKMTLPASYAEKYLSLCVMVVYRSVYWIVGIVLGLAAFVGIAVLIGTGGMLDAEQFAGVLQNMDPLIILFVPQMLMLIGLASATTPRIQWQTAILGLAVFAVIMAADMLYRYLVNDFMPMWVSVALIVLGEVPIILWSYRKMKYIQPNAVATR